MKLAAIIAEYNPFHLGHKYQIEKARTKYKIDYIMAIMSASFVQRGQPAIINKYDRARLAVENGVNLVIELPSYYSIQSAEFFAKAAIKILDHSRLVDYLLFGTDSNLNNIIQIENKIRDNYPSYRQALMNYMNLGLSYRLSFNKALADLGIKEGLKSNDILGLEYIRALKATDIKPLAIKRKGGDHQSREVSGAYASSSHIRKLILEDRLNEIKGLVPENTYQAILYNKKNNSIHQIEEYYDLLKYKVFVEGADFKEILAYEDGMDGLIAKNLQISNSMGELIKKSSSKRYTASRISRFLLAYLLDFKKGSQGQAYIRPLAFDSKGAEILKGIKENSSIEIVSKFSRQAKKDSNVLINYELAASNLYNLIGNGAMNLDFYKSPLYIEN